MLPDQSEGTPEEEVAERLTSAEVREALHSLSGRERMVLGLRFGLMDGRARTLAEVSKEYRPPARSIPARRPVGI
jgi:RNA polymerase primary sigma factor